MLKWWFFPCPPPLFGRCLYKCIFHHMCRQRKSRSCSGRKLYRFCWFCSRDSVPLYVYLMLLVLRNGDFSVACASLVTLLNGKIAITSCVQILFFWNFRWMLVNLVYLKCSIPRPFYSYWKHWASSCVWVLGSGLVSCTKTTCRGPCNRAISQGFFPGAMPSAPPV